MRLRNLVRAVVVGLTVGAAVLVVVATSAAPVAARPQVLTRYTVVHGCYAVRSRRRPLPGSPFRMQAAALGVYLLYTPQAQYLVDAGGGRLQTVATPSPAAEWTLTGTMQRGFVITNSQTGTRLPVAFKPASGCAVYPEAQVGARGGSFTGASPEAGVLGTVEGHAHVTAFELFGGDWHCGSPWSPYGAPYALPASCAQDEQGTNGEVESFLDYGGATRPSDMHGWPTFVHWPSPTALAEEGDYYTGIERAWKAGLRLMVTDLVDNQALCSIMTKKHNPCLDMADVQIQSRDLYALQNYIDAQSGGPGRGWFRIVTDPFQARRVINQGKLAVIEGIEMSELFGCGERNGQPQCNQADVDAGLQQVMKEGVRTFFPVHEFNNAFGGSKMISGDTGALINAGNFDETGSFFQLKPCPAEDQDAEQISFAPAGPLASLLNGPGAQLLHGSPLPIYGSGPQCNQQGLTALGTYLIHQMIAHHLIIQIDHMDSKTAAAAVGIASDSHYAGVVSAHCCNSPQLFGRVYATGGFVDPAEGPPTYMINTWKADKAKRDPRFTFGFGYGSDMNGLASQDGPNPGQPISYPFRAYRGHVTFTKERWGQRVFDLNTDGLANYGLYADWLRELQTVGNRQFMNDMFHGAEAYLEMWERAYGVPLQHCLAGSRFTSTGLGPLRLGDTFEQSLYRAGQPLSRPGRSFRYCVAGGGRAASVYGASGRIELIARSARTVPPRGSRRIAAGLYRHGRMLYGSRFVALVSPALVARRSALAADLRAAGLTR